MGELAILDWMASNDFGFSTCFVWLKQCRTAIASFARVAAVLFPKRAACAAQSNKYNFRRKKLMQRSVGSVNLRHAIVPLFIGTDLPAAERPE